MTKLRWIGMGLGWGMALSALAQDPAAVVHEINIRSDGEIDRPAILDVLLLKPGQGFTQELLDRSLQRLSENFRFQSSEASFDTDTGLLQLDLSPLPILSRVEIRLLDAESKHVEEKITDDLSQVVGFSPGDAIFLESVSEIRDRLQTRLHDRGYLEANVLIALEQKEKETRRVLSATVQLGKRSSLRYIHFKGFNTADVESLGRALQSNSEIRQILDNFIRPTQAFKAQWAERRGTPEEASREIVVEMSLPLDWLSINESLNRWGLEAKEKGYYDFQYSARIEERGDDLHFHVELRRGTRYNVQFTGNVAFWERDIRARVLDRTLRFGVPFSVADSELLLTRLYEANGFADISVRVRNEGDDLKRKITFEIDEGKQYILKSLRISGVADAENKEMDLVVREWLKAIQNPFHPIYYDEKLLRSMLPDLLKKIRDRGFLQARLLEFQPQRSKESQWVHVSLAAQLGPRSRIRSLSVLGNTVLTSTELNHIVDIELGSPASPSQIVDVNQRLAKSYQELGFMSVDVSADENLIFKGNTDGSDVDIELSITPGPQILVGKVIVEGLRDTHERVVSRELTSDTLRSGHVWTPSGRDKLEERLLGLGIFSNARTDAIGGRVVKAVGSEGSAIETQEKDLKINLVERPGGTIEFGPGYRSDLGLIGSAEWTYRNLGGWNRNVLVRSQVSGKLDHYQFLEQKYSFAYIEPYLLIERMRFRVGTSYSKEDKTFFRGDSRLKGYNLEEVTISTGIEKEFGRHFRLFQNLYTVSLPRFFDVVDAQGQDAQKYKIATMGSTLTFDNRSNVLSPYDGIFAAINLEYSGPKIGSSQDAHYFKLSQDFATYFKMAPRSIIAISTNYSRLWGLSGSNGVPLNKRLVLGGQASIRSFREGFLAFNDAGLLNQQSFETKIEYRHPVLADFGLAFFYDTGILDSFEFGKTGWRKAAGVGIRYETAVGPLALDFAYNLDLQPGEEAVKVQFGIGRF